jgi:AraC family transcriptional regulator
MAASHPYGDREQALAGGRFYGSATRRVEHSCALFTDLHHHTARKLPAHCHDLPLFSLMLAGDYSERYVGQEAQFCPFSITFRPAGVPHQDEVGPRGVSMFMIELCHSGQKRLAPGGAAALDAHGGEMFCLGLKLYGETRGPVPPEDLCTESLLAELAGAVTRNPEIRGEGAPPWLRRVRDKLHAECCSRITLDELSLEAGVHPVHLSRVFRRQTGRGIGEYVHRLRVRSACEQLLERDRPLADISVATGFADQSHFTRTFRKFTGTTPAAFRSLVMVEEPKVSTQRTRRMHERREFFLAQVCRP